jgi:hypothetical protein
MLSAFSHDRWCKETASYLGAWASGRLMEADSGVEFYDAPHRQYLWAGAADMAA